jgi:hypothetical protein
MGIVQFQAYAVLTYPEQRLLAMTDPRTREMLRRISWFEHDCYICNRTMDLASHDGDATPGIIGYMHGDLPDEIGAVTVAVCSACVRKLGDDATALQVSQMFIDEHFGGGHVEHVQCGRA